MARLHTIRPLDVANTYWGPAVSLFFNYCPWHCKNCWNSETWEVDESLEIPNDEVVKQVIEALDAEGIKKDISLLGGDPLADLNRPDVQYILEKVLEARPDTRVLCWTGYTWRRCKDFEVMKYIDILIDGLYVEKLRVLGKKYGSSNQKIIDVKKSLETGEVVILETSA